MTSTNAQHLNLDFQQADLRTDDSRVILQVLRAIVMVSDLKPGEADEMRRTWNRCLWIPDENASDSDSIPHSVIKRDPNMSWALFHELLVGTATSIGIESCRGEYLMFHAAALAHPRSGQAIALVAPSGTGKTTAARKLGTALSYLTDETTVISTGRSMIPYPKPLSLFSDSGTRPKNQHSPDEFGFLPSVAHAELSRLAILDRVKDQGLDSAYFVELSKLEMLERLIPESSSLAQLPRGLAALCTLVDSLGGVQAVRYTEAEQLIPLLVKDLESPQPAHGPDDGSWHELPLERDESVPPAPGRYRRVRVDDALMIDGSVALLKGQEFTVLDGLGPMIWESLAKWTSTESLTDALILAFGPHPEARLIVEATLENLEGRGLVEESVSCTS